MRAFRKWLVSGGFCANTTKGLQLVPKSQRIVKRRTSENPEARFAPTLGWELCLRLATLGPAQINLYLAGVQSNPPLPRAKMSCGTGKFHKNHLQEILPNTHKSQKVGQTASSISRSSPRKVRPKTGTPGANLRRWPLPFGSGHGSGPTPSNLPMEPKKNGFFKRRLLYKWMFFGVLCANLQERQSDN